MIKEIPSILSPKLLKVLCEMGRSDTIVIADGNFPSETIGKNAIVIHADGHGVPETLETILKVDTYVENPVHCSGSCTYYTDKVMDFFLKLLKRAIITVADIVCYMILIKIMERLYV